MMRALVVCLALSLPSAAAAQLSPPIEAPAADPARALERRLVVIEGEVSAGWVRALSAPERALLASLAEDRGRALVVRRRAVSALRHLHEPAIFALLVRRAEDQAEDAIVSRYALRALALGFGAEAFSAVAGRLGDPRPHVRAGAAEALIAIDPARARAPLQRALSAEPEAFVRLTLERLLAD